MFHVLFSVPTDPQRFLNYLKNGNKPKKGQHCPEDIYEIIENCLNLDKWKRKTFTELYSTFNDKIAALSDNYPSTPDPGSEEGTTEFGRTDSRTRSGTWRIPKQNSLSANTRCDSIITVNADPPPPYYKTSESDVFIHSKIDYV